MAQKAAAQPMMPGGTSILSSFGAQYKWPTQITPFSQADAQRNPGKKAFSDGNKTMTTTSETFVLFEADKLSPMPSNLKLEHHCKGGVSDSAQELLAELNFGRDPRPPMQGGTGGYQVSGSVGITQVIKDPTVPKTSAVKRAEEPRAPSGTT